MAISFKNIKDPKLGITDTITFGKLKGCRICDVAQDHYEYLIWAEKSGYVKYQAEVVALIQEQASFAAWKIHEEQEVKPWFEDDLLQREREMIRSIQDDDVPF
jgi:uncharacterized protein (DUF3820 family)